MDAACFARLPDAQNNLGLLFYTGGEGLAKDARAAAQLFEKSAAQGYALGQANLGRAYLNGEGVKQDFVAAQMWLTRAAKQGETAVKVGDADPKGGAAQAQQLLGYMYASGSGVERNYEKAIAYFKQAALQADGTALSNLGYAYSSGSGVAKSDSRAFTYYALAMRFGEGDAQAKRDDIGKRLMPDERAAARQRAESWQVGQTLP